MQSPRIFLVSADETMCIDWDLESVREMVSRFCYVFSRVGMTDLKLRLGGKGSMSFFHDKAPESTDKSLIPRIGFYQSEPERYAANHSVYQDVMAQHTRIAPAPLSIVCAFVSVANATRASFEVGLFGRTDPSTRYDQVARIYENAIRLSGDDSAIKMVALISKRKNSVTFCSTDDDVTGLVPEDLRMVVAEAFAGMAMCALHQVMHRSFFDCARVLIGCCAE